MTKQVLISVLCGNIVMLKITAESPNSAVSSSLVDYLKKLKEIPSLEELYDCALTLGVGTEENLIVMNKEEDYIFKGPGKIDEMFIHNFQKARYNTYTLNGPSEYYQVNMPMTSN